MKRTATNGRGAAGGSADMGVTPDEWCRKIAGKPRLLRQPGR
jgi:hypothetical protein